MRILLRLLGFLWPFRWRVALATSLGILTIVGNVGLLATAAYVISAAAVVAYLSMLAVPVYLVRFFSILRALSRYTERVVSHDATFRLLTNLRTWFYGALEPLAPARLWRYRSGDLLARIVKDVGELENLYLRAVSPVVVALLCSLLAFALFSLFDAFIALVVLAFLVSCGVGVPLIVERLSRGVGRRQIALRAELEARLVEDIQGVRDVLAFGREEAERREISALDRKLGKSQRKMALVSGLQASLTDLLMNLCLVAVLVLAVPLVAAGDVSGVYLALLALVALGSFEAVAPLGEAFRFMGRSLQAGERLFELVDAEPEVSDPPETRPVPDHPLLEFDGVSFRYAADEPPALEEVSFRIEPGGRVAVVGPSGSGKSTLVNLILRFWDPTGGEVRLGGHDLREYAQADLREKIGVVSQETHVFGDTLRANLLLAAPDAGEDELRDALERARLSETVGRLPRGLDTYVGEQGARLSGGERQRLAVARAFLGGAPVLVLDEPTANLDVLTERELLAALRELMRGRTTLMMTHRLVEMEEMDEILVLSGGRIVERGTHEELVGAGGLYRRMFEVQRGMLSAT
ncbi:thiol reductant ABC exporter subunit CydC [Rubrobacter xylanophilus]|uniref:Thiol reductant ABC exporter subunit CydC n=1 Tax=Rubrobacter xylanophilus TaxID=49319 RepID=A0A510HMM6_9ACTN|nr:thiol reductant ABC exporter subunit CydC [Rubrobacter xylanophilus]BBL79823.1 thiol reductant ABC exporter subunit CydC [Rubrobacter xylanophilus]